MLALTLVYCDLLNSSQDNNVEMPQQLGRARNQFGAPSKGADAYLLWTQPDRAITTMLFPAGEGRRRYFFTLNGEGQPAGTLSYEENTSRGIQCLWAVDLERLGTSSPLSLEGTLQQYIWRRGFRVKGVAPHRALAALRAKKPFASYTLRLLSDSLAYGYIFENGNCRAVGTLSVDPKQNWPNIGFDYPITTEEATWLRRNRNVGQFMLYEGVRSSGNAGVRLGEWFGKQCQPLHLWVT